MKVCEETSSRLVLKGVPGRAAWMVACVGIGLLLTAAAGWFAGALYRQTGGLTFGHLPLGVGILIGQGIFWTGVVTLAIGQVVLVLDKAKGTGEYRVRSPVFDVGEPCTFNLQDIQDIVIETTVEVQPRGPDRTEGEVTVHRLRLRLRNPRRVITLDETQNDRRVRLQKLADRVTGFLGRAGAMGPVADTAGWMSAPRADGVGQCGRRATRRNPQ